MTMPATGHERTSVELEDVEPEHDGEAGRGDRDVGEQGDGEQAGHLRARAG